MLLGLRAVIMGNVIASLAMLDLTVVHVKKDILKMQLGHV